MFEDDIHLGEHASQFLKTTDWIPQDIQIIKLEAFYSEIEVNKSTAINVEDNRKLYKLRSKHLGGAGYILSKNAAKILLEYIKFQNNLKPLDHLLFEDVVLMKLFQS
uniref:Glyco_transf_25 n=1 Tax=uncultured Psychrobacter sp. TaxID=259303 RepID=A0A060CRC7_9GAMM|nr:Glyco_transf_25 [uncultured Psychrobacter sp.]